MATEVTESEARQVAEDGVHVVVVDSRSLGMSAPVSITG